MSARRFSVGVLLALLASPTYQAGTLERLSATTLTPTGPTLRIPFDSWGVTGLVLQGNLVTVATRTTVRIVDMSTMRVAQTYRLPRASVCTVGLDGTTPVALVGCGRMSHRYALVRLDPGRWITVRRPLATIGYPVSFAFGDGKLFVARDRSAGVDVIDMRTGAVVSHRPRRSLAKGEDWVQARWLGGHLLGLNGVAVDVRTWRTHTLAAHAKELIADAGFVGSYGSDGVAVFTRSNLKLYRRFLRGQVVDQARIVSGVLYARVALLWQRFDIRTGRSLGGRILLDDAENLWLL